MTDDRPPSMSDGRALLTDREREALTGGATDNYRYKTRSYFRNRLEKLERDVALLAEHDPELLEELRSVVCGGEPERTAAPARPEPEPAPSEGTAESGNTRRDTPPREPAVDEPQADGLPDVGELEFKRDLNPRRREELRRWLEHVRDTGEGVTKSDFEGWWSDDRGERTGYNAGSFWEAFAKASMKQLEHFEQPNARTYRWVGPA